MQKLLKLIGPGPVGVNHVLPELVDIRTFKSVLAITWGNSTTMTSPALETITEENRPSLKVPPP